MRWTAGGVDRAGWARDVSDNGAGFTVRSLSAPPVGAKIRVVFDLEEDQEWVVDERAIVTRCDEHSQGLCDIGVRFTLPESVGAV